MPAVDWELTGRDVLVTEWIDGDEADRTARRSSRAGHDPKRIAAAVVQSFLRHALRDGFFHADMHEGNLFVDRDGRLVAVDFGIMGRLGPKERRFLAEILYGFIRRDYRRIAEVHIEAGYVPGDPLGGGFRPGAARHRRADPRPPGAARSRWRSCSACCSR